MKVQRFFVVFFLLLVVAGISCCSAKRDVSDLDVTKSDIPTSVAQESKPSEFDMPVTHLSFLPSTSHSSHYQALAEAFNAQHAAIQIQVLDPDQVPPDPNRTPQETLHLLASSADVFLYLEFDPTTLAESGAVLDLQPLLKGHTDLGANDFFPSLLTRFQDSGGLWGIPVGVAPPVIFYNKALFATAGVPAPRPGWTWDEFVSAAQQLTDPAAGVWGFFELWGYSSGDILACQHGGVLLDDDGAPTFDDPLVAEALAWYAALGHTHQVMPLPDSPDAPGGHVNTLPQLGRAAMWAASSDWRNRSADTGVAPFPRDRQDVTPALTFAHYVSVGTASPEAALQWIDFVTRQQPEQGVLPVRRSVFTSESYRTGLDDETYTTYNHILQRLVPSPRRYPWFREAYFWLADQGLPSVMLGQMDLTAALQQAQSQAVAARSGAPRTTDAPVVEIAQPTPTDPGVIALTFRPHGDIPEFGKLVQRFQKDHADVRVRIAPKTRSGTTTLEDRVAGVDVIDVQSGVAPWAEKYFLSLQPFINADPGVDLEDFYPVALEPYRHQGDLWGLPIQIDAYLMFYNKAIFDAAELPYPEASWTWDDLAQAAVQLTQGEGATKQWGLVVVTSGWKNLLLILAAQHGSALVDNPAAPQAPTLDDPSVVETVRWFRDLDQVQGVLAPPAFDFEGWFDNEALYLGGQAAMWIVNQGMMGGGSIGHLNVGVVPLPVQGQPATVLYPRGYAISNQTAHPQQAWDWLVFASRQPTMSQYMPARRSLANQALFLGYPPQLQDELRLAYRQTLDSYVQAQTVVLGQATWSDVIDRLFTQAVRESWETRADPQETLETAQAIAEAYLACLELHGDPEDPEHGLACETEVGVPGWPELYGFPIEPAD